jgi:hypothetical protein
VLFLSYRVLACCLCLIFDRCPIRSDHDSRSPFPDRSGMQGLSKAPGLDAATNNIPTASCGRSTIDMINSREKTSFQDLCVIDHFHMERIQTRENQTKLFDMQCERSF